MNQKKAICNKGCQKDFLVTEFKTEKLDGGIEKTYFTCPHCLFDYVSFYTNAEIRKLQEKVRKVLRKTAEASKGYAAMLKQEKKIQKEAQKLRDEIAFKMTILRARVERDKGSWN